MNNIAFIDGGRVPGSRKTVIGGIIFADGVEIIKYSEIAGEGSNTDAEFHALFKCMELAIQHGITSIHIKTDARVIVDSFKTEYEVLGSMINIFEQDSSNSSLKKAISIRARQNFNNLKSMKMWMVKNKPLLEVKMACSPKYRDRLFSFMAILKISVELIPRNANSIADGLCIDAKRNML